MLGLVLRALRWRAGLSITVWVCAVVVCAGAALGPVFALAAAESGLQDVLRDAGAATGIRLTGTSGGSQQVTVPEAAQRLAAAKALPAIAHRPTRLGSLYIQGDGAVGDGVMHTRMVWRDGACAQVRLDAGRCPTGPGEAMVSARAKAIGIGWDVGKTLSITTPDYASIDMRIVGVYTPIATQDPRWSGQAYFQTGVDREGVPITDSVFVSRGTFDLLPSGTIVQEAVDLPLTVRGVHLADVDALRQQVVTLRQEGRAAHFACVLGWLVLHRVLVDTIEARSADIALAKLRGFGRGALLRFGLGEPIVLLLVAVPVGAVLAYAAGVVLSGIVLLPDTPVVFPWQAGLALAAAVAGGVGAIVQSASGALRRPVLDQWRRTRADRRGSRAGLVADIGVAVLAAIAFVVLRIAGPRVGPLTLLGPGLLISAAGFAGARLLPVVLRPLVPATTASRRVAVFLAVRQVVRRPAGLRLVALLTVAVGLAVFGIGGEAVAIDNRAARAATEIGATSVERLQYTPGEDVVAEVAKADPDGRWAAASAIWLGFGASDVLGEILAVDAHRLPVVGAPAPLLASPATLADLATQGAAAPAVVRGRSIGARITLSDQRGAHAPIVVFELRNADGGTVEVASTALRTGTADYQVAVPCAKGCTLAGIELTSNPAATTTVTGTVLVDRITVDGKVLDAGLTTNRAWRAAETLGDAHDEVSVGASGTTDRFRTGTGGTGGLERGDLLDPVPTIVGGHGARTTRVGAVLSTESASGRTVDLKVVDAEPVLPQVLDDGVLVDLRSFQSALPTFAIDAQWSVWIGPNAPHDALARLRAAGLVTDGGSTLAARSAELARQGPALALLLLAVCAVAGALLAMGGTAVSIGAAVRRRSYEAAALGTVGIRRGQLYRAALTEQLLLLGTAIVVGVPAGLLALLLALPAVPQSSEDSPVPMALLPPALPVVVCAAALIVLVGVTVLVSAGRVVRAGSTARLREAEE